MLNDVFTPVPHGFILSHPYPLGLHVVAPQTQFLVLICHTPPHPYYDFFFFIKPISLICVYVWLSKSQFGSYNLTILQSYLPKTI